MKQSRTKDTKVRVNVRIPEDIYPKLEELARKQNRTVPNLLSSLGIAAVEQEQQLKAG
jgi:hypothetical protein